MTVRRYQTAFTLAKIMEIISWIILIGGLITGLAMIPSTGTTGIIIAISSIPFGFILVFSAQLTLIFIETENNTHKAMNELIKTNAMLSETLGKILLNTNKIHDNKD